MIEAEKIITSAPHIATEADLAEGYDYLAGSIRASLTMAWAYQRDFPFFVASTGPYTKLGLDNPDTLYFHAYLRDDAEYVVSGRRGSTADLSFQVLGGDYTPVQVPDSLSAFDDRAIDIGADGSFEVRFGPAAARPAGRLFHARQGLSHADRPRGLQRLGQRAARHGHRSAGPTPPGPRRPRPTPASWRSGTAWPARS